MAFGPNGSVTTSWLAKRISPNSCHAPDSSWPAEVQNMLSKVARSAAGTAASHAPRAALKKFWPQGSGLGVARVGFGQSAVTFWKFWMWYW